MSLADRSISAPATPPPIRQLDEAAINRIAAGEVVERPASAVKELVENALDAGARRIGVEIAGGGKVLIRITDDGCGMSADDLPMALSRHATSKIDGSDLLDIRSFGFRGEALPSLGSVGRLTIISRPNGAAGTSRPNGEAAQIRCDGGRLSGPVPAALSRGTVVELKDLFYATPARLKFLRTDRAETLAVADVVRRLALAEPFVSFTLTDVTDGQRREILRTDAAQGELWGALEARIAAVIGRDFTDNALRIDTARDSIGLSGLAGLPTYSRGAAVEQFLFVNGRPVRDRLLLGALQAAYSDVLPRGRYPAAVLFVDCDPQLVDVNVHPAKAEVRFRDPQGVRGLIVGGLRQALAGAGHRSSTTVADETLRAFTPGTAPPAPAPRIYQMDFASRPTRAAGAAALDWQAPRDPAPHHPGTEPAPAGLAEPAAGFGALSGRVESPADPGSLDLPLGAARAQLHGNWILAQTRGGMVIVDQHAAHERLTYEKLKAARSGAGIGSQALLIPEIVEPGAIAAARLLAAAPELARLGLELESFGIGAVAVRAVPAILGQPDIKALLADITDELAELPDTPSAGSAEAGVLQGRIDAILSRMACHGSIRSGRQMRAEEMNALLREMEATPLSGQCNHGRPTWVELKLSDIERLFGRS